MASAAADKNESAHRQVLRENSGKACPHLWRRHQGAISLRQKCHMPRKSAESRAKVILSAGRSDYQGIGG
jgi:hypothetical protein